MMTNLKRRFFIKNLKKECLHIIQNCRICIANKSFNVMRQPFGTKLKITGPRQVYALDICTVDYKVTEIDNTLPSSFLIVTDVWRYRSRLKYQVERYWKNSAYMS